MKPQSVDPGTTTRAEAFALVQENIRTLKT